jgi:hypothetical protein
LKEKIKREGQQLGMLSRLHSFSIRSMCVSVVLRSFFYRGVIVAIDIPVVHWNLDGDW